MNEISKIKELIAQVLRDNNFTVHTYQLNEHDIDMDIKGYRRNYILMVNRIDYEKKEKITN